MTFETEVFFIMLVRTFAPEKWYLEDYVLPFLGMTMMTTLTTFQGPRAIQAIHFDGARSSTSKGWVEYIDLQAVSRGVDD